MTMPMSDPMERLNRLWDQQRRAFEEAREHLQRSGRKVADALSEALRRVPTDDLRTALQRVESQQREVLSRLVESQRDTVERLLESTSQASETLWKAIRSAMSDLADLRAQPPERDATSAREAPAPKPPAAKAGTTSVKETGAAKAGAAKTSARKTAARKTATKKAPTKKAPRKGGTAPR
jgi:peptidoglycan hydrolase CwlO-like protein